jgi:cyclopropane fatty-acyl-phospholipid synthase-like methyltransferase
MELSEAEIQVLATLRLAEVEGLGSDRASLETEGDRFWVYLEDWSDSYAQLSEKGLIEGGEDRFVLTVDGRPLASVYHEQRPDHYWYYYQRFYPAALASNAHSELCRRVFGRDLTQEGQMDMEALDGLLERLNLSEGYRVLDLGCGAGAISEYISDTTGAVVTGVDYAALAVQAANDRIKKRDRLTFIEGDLNHLQLDPEDFDAVVLIDSIYWASDTSRTLSSILASLNTGGQMAVVIAQTLEDGDRPELLEAENTEVGAALDTLGVEYRVFDDTHAFKAFWPRMKEAVVDLRSDFLLEGNRFIADALEAEADEEYLPAIRDDEIRRYTYLIHKM